MFNFRSRTYNNNNEINNNHIIINNSNKERYRTKQSSHGGNLLWLGSSPGSIDTTVAEPTPKRAKREGLWRKGTRLGEGACSHPLVEESTEAVHNGARTASVYTIAVLNLYSVELTVITTLNLIINSGIDNRTSDNYLEILNWCDYQCELSWKYRCAKLIT